ncbi:MAG: hypothetical protein QM804_16820 [Propionicimonas sp.]
MSRPWLVITLVIYGVVASISMVVLGWPEETPAQVALLELSALPLQGALGVGLWHLSRRARPLGNRGRLARWLAVGLAGLGVILAGIAYLGPRGLVHFGLALIWIGLLMGLVLVVAHLPRRPMRSQLSALPSEEDEDDQDEGLDMLHTAAEPTADEVAEPVESGAAEPVEPVETGPEPAGDATNQPEQR